MNIRRARSSDIPRLLELLRQVNNVHADGHPDLFKHDMTKYSASELETLVTDDNKPIFVSVDDTGLVLGYAFCRFEVEKGDGNLVPGKDLYIDDICFDEKFRARDSRKIFLRGSRTSPAGKAADASRCMSGNATPSPRHSTPGAA